MLGYTVANVARLKVIVALKNYPGLRNSTSVVSMVTVAIVTVAMVTVAMVPVVPQPECPQQCFYYCSRRSVL